MPTDTESIISLSKSIGDLAQKFENGATPSKEVRQGLVLASERLSIAVREPDENVYHNSGLVRYFQIRQAETALNLERFRKARRYEVQSL